MYTANSIKVVFQKVLTVNYERARDDGLLFILALILGVLPFKKVNLPSYISYLPSMQFQINNSELRGENKYEPVIP